jgi:hypothetical protein
MTATLLLGYLFAGLMLAPYFKRRFFVSDAEAWVFWPIYLVIILWKS